MINWLITMFTEWLMLIYYFNLFSRSNKSKITHNENSYSLPILFFNKDQNSDFDDFENDRCTQKM